MRIVDPKMFISCLYFIDALKLYYFCFKNPVDRRLSVSIYVNKY